MAPKAEVFRILMAEDDPDDVVLMREALRESGCGVPHVLETVGNGCELMERLRVKGNDPEHGQAHAPDLILLDLNMPRKDGREVLVELKSDDRLRVIPVLVLTNSANREDVVHCYKAGANSYLVKPSAFDSLKEMAGAVKNYWCNIAVRTASPSGTVTPTPGENAAAGSP